MVDAELAFVQMTEHVLDVLPLCRGCQAHIFMAVGAFLMDPIAPSTKDLCKYSGVSKPPVLEALSFLCTHEFVHCLVDDDGTRRYRPDPKYFRRLGGPAVSVRERVLVQSRRGRSKEKLYPPLDDDVNISSDPVLGPTHQSSCAETRKILMLSGVVGKKLIQLSQAVAPAHAQAWVDSLQYAPDNVDSPLAVMIAALSTDPASPVQWKPKMWFDSKYAPYVNR